MKNYLGTGDMLEVTAPSDVKAGDIVVLGSITGIATDDAAEGETVVLKTSGVFEVTKTAGTAWTVGAPVYAADGAATLTAGTNAYLGVATDAAAADDTAGTVKLGGEIPITWGA